MIRNKSCNLYSPLRQINWDPSRTHSPSIHPVVLQSISAGLPEFKKET